MNIWINSSALKGSTEILLSGGALYALKRFNDNGYETSWDTEALSSRQVVLLDNEQVQNSGVNQSEAEAVIHFDDSELNLEIDGKSVATGSNWTELVKRFFYPARTASKKRKTGETDIVITLNIDGTGKSRIDTGLKFFDHMLEQIARHGLIDLDIHCKGDLQIDEHHTIEDVAITLGETLYEAGGRDKTGIQRYGFLLPMDEAQAEVALDLSNRPYLVWKVGFAREYVGDFPLEMAEHFFHTLAMSLRSTLQIRAEGKNEHHKIEAIFKGFAKAYRYAVTRTERMKNILPSSKGAL